MFDSGQKTGNVNRALVALSLSDGSVSTVAVKLPLSNKLADVLNGPDQFLDVMTTDGEQLFLAKSDIRRVRLVDVPRANQLNLQRRHSDKASFDPFAVLKIDKTAGAEDVRQAYHKLSRLYHPDRIAAFDLPEEVHDYARAMQVRINLAYEQIGR